MTPHSFAAAFASVLVLAACTSQPPAPPPSAGAETGSGYVQNGGQFEFALGSGDYRCELGVKLHIGREVRDKVNHRIQLGWNGHTYSMERDPSNSGLPRFEDAAKSLVWIDLPWKGLLLDGRTQKPIANECRLA
ncbi:MAG: hypothetical protein J0M28_10750 [Thauera sp.]|nr:hypothetical protein [Thauera sp.]